MTTVRRLVLDVLKPHEPPLIDFTARLSDLETVEGVNGTLIELDQEVQNVKFTFEGSALDDDEIEAAIEELGGTVHSVDQVVCGESVVEHRRTLQDS